MENIPTRWATPQGLLGTNTVCHRRSTQLSPSRSTTWKYANHMGYFPRVAGHQPCTTYQPIDKCHTQLSPSRSIVTGQPNSVNRGVRLGKYPNRLSYTSRVPRHQPNISSQVNPTKSIEEYDLENVSRS
jgi:hypothetical protein